MSLASHHLFTATAPVNVLLCWHPPCSDLCPREVDLPRDDSKIVAMPSAITVAPAVVVRPRRPVWVWAICVYVAIGAVTFPLSVLWMLQAGAITVAAEVVIALGVPCTLLNIAAAVALIRLRKLAVTLFAVSLIFTGFA